MTRMVWQPSRRSFVLGTAALAGAAVMPASLRAQTRSESLTIGMALEPPHLDPTAGAAAAIDEVVYANVFEGLTRIDESGQIVPCLANSWGISADGLDYLFNLERDVAFHDGRPFDAAVVKFSLERAMSSDSTNAQKRLFAPIETVTVVDSHSVALRLKRPFGGLLFNLGWGDAVMVHPDSAANNKTAPIGTGPYRVGRVVKGDRVELERSPSYWGTAPSINRVVFKFVPDAAAQVASLLAGDVDAFPNIGSPETLTQFQADPRFVVSIGTTEGETILAMNNQKGPLSDPRVRRAIAHAIDRQALIDGAMFGYGTPIGSHFAPHDPAYVDLTGVTPHDPARARALLSEAGYSGGLEFGLVLPPPTYARRGGEIVASQLAAVGIRTRIVQVEWAQWLDGVFAKKAYDLTIVSHTEPLDVDIYGREDYYFGYRNPLIDNLLTDLDRQSQPLKRAAVYGAIQAILAEDVPNAFLFQLPKLGVWRADLDGLWENAPIQANDVTQVRRR